MFILSNLNISTTTIGINTSITVSKMFIAGNTGILNIFLNAGTNITEANGIVRTLSAEEVKVEIGQAMAFYS